MNWINIKDELPEIEKEVLFIEKFIANRLSYQYVYVMHNGWFDDGKKYFVAADGRDWYGDNEDISLENIVCWTYYDAEQIAKQNEGKYYKRINNE